MAIADNNLWAGGDPDYDELSINTNPLPGEAGLRMRCSTRELEQLDTLYRSHVAAYEASEGHIDTHNRPDPELVAAARRANDAYQLFRESLFDAHPELDADRRRGDFDPTPPGKVGEVLGRSTMLASSAMGMLDDMHSGYYEGLEDVNTLEAVYGMKGRRETLDVRFVTEWARRFALPFFSYDHKIEDLQLAMQIVRSQAHPHFPAPVFARRDTTVQRARALLMGIPHDGAIYINDEHGRLRHIVTRTDVGMDAQGHFTNGDHQTLGDLELASADQIITARVGATLGEVQALMRGKRSPKRVPILDEEGKVRYSISRLQSQYAERMGQYFGNEPAPMNFAVSIGVSSKDDMLARIDAAIQGGASMITLETAHAYRRDIVRKLKQDFLPQMAESMSDDEQVAYVREHRSDIAAMIKHIRSKAKDRKILIGFGTVTSPEAVRLLAALGVDVVKVGVGGGNQCTTFDATGVGGPPFGYLWRCGRAAAGLGIQIMADGGINTRRRVGLISSLHGVGLLQMGSWPGRTVEAASPPTLRDGVWKRRMYGEASEFKHATAQHRKGVEIDEDDLLVHHAEGQVVWEPMAQGNFANAGGIVLGSTQSLASDGSYTDATAVEEYQNSARIRRISKTPTKLA